MAFTHKLNVRFDDVDYAQIVYYPKLFTYCHWVFEEFFAREAGVPYATMLIKRRVGFPTVHATADFRHPLRFGDVARVVMETVKLGERSIGSAYAIYLGDTNKLCAELEVTTVAIDMDTFKPKDLPEDVRVAFLNHLRGYKSA